MSGHKNIHKSWSWNWRQTKMQNQFKIGKVGDSSVKTKLIKDHTKFQTVADDLGCIGSNEDQLLKSLWLDFSGQGLRDSRNTQSCAVNFREQKCEIFQSKFSDFYMCISLFENVTGAFFVKMLTYGLCVNGVCDEHSSQNITSPELHLVWHICS